MPTLTLPLEPVVGDRVMTPWTRARRLLSLDREDLKLCVVYSVAIGILSLVTPIAVQTVINTVSFGTVLQPLVVMTILVALALTFAGVMRLLQAQVIEALQERMLVRGVIDLSQRVLRADPQALARIHPPELAHRFFEMPTLQKTSATVFVDGIDLLLKLAVGLPLLAFYHPWLAVFSLLLLGALALVVFVCGRGAVVTAIGESTAKYEAASWLEHLARIPSAFRSTEAREDARNRALEIARRYRDARSAHFQRLLRHLVGGVGLTILGSALLLGVGGALVMQNQLTLGQLVAAELVFATIGLALLKLSKQLEAAYDLLASAHKIGLLLDLPLEPAGVERVTTGEPATVALHDIALGYAGDPRHVLAGASTTIAARDRVVVFGAAASGKSTLLDALATTLPPTAGTIAIDGLDLRLADLDHLRRGIVLVREPELVASTILGNLRLARPDVPMAAIVEAVRAVGLDEMIAALPDGFATPILPTGRPLSRTQARRLSLARALLARPRLLLLDGALDDLGLSAMAFDQLLDQLFDPGAPWTLVVASTDPRVIARCNRLATLEQGRLEVTDARV